MQSGTNFAVSPPRLSPGVAKNALTLGRTGTVKSLWCEPFRRSPSRHFNASSSRAYLLYSLIYTLSLPSPFCQFCSPLIFRPFSTLPLLHAAPSPRRPSLSLPSLLLIRPIRPIRLIRVQKKIIRVQKKLLSDSCANTPSKLSPALYKPQAKASAIPLKSRKMQIFSNFLSQSLARFRKSPYFCTR